MGVDLGLQGFDPGLVEGNLLLGVPFKLILQFIGQGVEPLVQVLKFPAAGGGLQVVAQLALLQMAHGRHQFVHRLGNIPAQELDHEQQQTPGYQDQDQHDPVEALLLLGQQVPGDHGQQPGVEAVQVQLPVQRIGPRLFVIPKAGVQRLT